LVPIIGSCRRHNRKLASHIVAGNRLQNKFRPDGTAEAPEIINRKWKLFPRWGALSSTRRKRGLTITSPETFEHHRAWQRPARWDSEPLLQTFIFLVLFFNATSIDISHETFHNLPFLATPKPDSLFSGILFPVRPRFIGVGSNVYSRDE
jgi:hypothetical protein